MKTASRAKLSIPYRPAPTPPGGAILGTGFGDRLEVLVGGSGLVEEEMRRVRDPAKLQESVRASAVPRPTYRTANPPW
jgi:hypothetical protein